MQPNIKPNFRFIAARLVVTAVNLLPSQHVTRCRWAAGHGRSRPARAMTLSLSRESCESCVACFGISAMIIIICIVFTHAIIICNSTTIANSLAFCEHKPPCDSRRACIHAAFPPLLDRVWLLFISFARVSSCVCLTICDALVLQRGRIASAGSRHSKVSKMIVD
jgi:hypothetical protein